MRTVVLIVLLSGLLSVQNAFAFEQFTIEDIQLKGLQRISKSTVFNYLPLKVGDTATEEKTAESIRELFKTGFFNDIKLEHENGSLIIQFLERPSIAKITIDGNDEISTEDLTEALKKVGLSEGRVFNRSLLEKVEQELQRQYFSLGKYGVEINSKLLPQERNRVAIDINIDEGVVARIRDINIIGNNSYSEELLLNTFNAGAHGPFSGISGNSKYEKEKLYADIEGLRSFYLDRGYINFNIESTQVTITPDKTDVFVTVNITEGDKFYVEDIDLVGEFIVEKEILRQLIVIQPGEVFSRKSIIDSSNKISERLGIEGYAFANVNANPDIDEETNKVKLTFFVDPGKRVYVRRVEFVGNHKTHDEVLRREMRQLEGGWISTTKLNRSKIRLQRTGFFEEVNIETPSVPGHPDLVDVVFSVTERSSGNIQASVGFGAASGFIISGAINQNNFLGTGKRVGIEINSSQINRVYSFSLSDPYYTLDGISRSINIFLRSTDASRRLNIANYSTDVYGVGTTFGFPLSEYRFTRLGLTYESTTIKYGASPPASFLEFAANGETLDSLTATGSWSYDTRNRALFADSGTNIVLSTDVALPVGNTTYAKINYKHQLFVGVYKDITLHLESLLSYGRGYGDNNQLPFYEYFFAGGSQSVRGFQERSLGPKEPGDLFSLGGNKRITGTGEFVFPLPFAEESNSTRFSTFLDYGQVYGVDEKFNPNEIRATYGLSFIWITPVGALRFSWAWPLITKPEDSTTTFQFSIGTPF